MFARTDYDEHLALIRTSKDLARRYLRHPPTATEDRILRELLDAPARPADALSAWTRAQANTDLALAVRRRETVHRAHLQYARA
jgi:hypothetical protein